MYNIVKLNDIERSQVFINVANSMGVTPEIIEKDFWVTIILDYLFNKSKFRNSFVFKGGTSLSKCYNLIQRFSEDIDIIIDWRLIGVDKSEPYLDRSKRKQEIYNKRLNEKINSFLENEIINEIKSGLEKLAGKNLEFRYDRNTPDVIYFSYPRLYEVNYIVNDIRIEIGALAAWTPFELVEVTSFVQDIYPTIFDRKIKVLAVMPERTFWEKATILHHEANRPSTSKMPIRYSRHYYDLYLMILSDCFDSAINKIYLLEKVVEFKVKFYPRGFAKYHEAATGMLRLVPDEYRKNDLSKDYELMKQMIFGEIIEFDVILTKLKEVEEFINSKILN